MFFTIASGKFCTDVADMKIQIHEAIGDSAFLFYYCCVTPEEHAGLLHTNSNPTEKNDKIKWKC